jgi:hypothetical protein
MITFKKTTPTCSNVYLIDENLCLSNSLKTINYNVSSLSSSIVDVTRYYTSWINLYTVFTTYSAKWIKTATNIQSFSATWLDTATTISSLSSIWGKPFTVYYPKMIDIVYWNSITKTNQNQTLINWLNVNFNPQITNLNQIIDVVVYFYQYQPFTFSFNRSLYEPCTPTGGGLSISCHGCGRPYRGCNHHGGRAGKGPCTNAYAACGVSTSVQAVSISCTGTGAKLLNVGLSRSGVDKNVARTSTIRFQNINKNWTAI